MAGWLQFDKGLSLKPSESRDHNVFTLFHVHAGISIHAITHLFSLFHAITHHIPLFHAHAEISNHAITQVLLLFHAITHRITSNPASRTAPIMASFFFSILQEYLWHTCVFHRSCQTVSELNFLAYKSFHVLKSKYAFFV